MVSSARFRALCLLFGLFIGGSLYAADAPPPDDEHADEEDQQVDVQKECQRVQNARVPQGDEPPPKSKGSMRECDAEREYYMTQTDPGAAQTDWDKVRACAITANDHLVLMMIYANGYGVKRNYDLSIKYACSLTGMRQDYDIDGLISDLSSLKGSSGAPGKSIDYASYATSGIALKFSDHLEWDKRKYIRERRLDKISQNWSKEHKAAFAKLRQAADEFAEASSRNETDQVGTGRAEFSDEMYAGEMDDFLRDIEASERGGFLSYTEAEFNEQDARLNEVYQGIMHPAKGKTDQPEIFTGITPDGIKKAQRAWLKYRDAWVAFGRLHSPSVPAYVWKAMLTERRTKQLRDLEGIE